MKKSYQKLTLPMVVDKVHIARRHVGGYKLKCQIEEGAKYFLNAHVRDQ